MYDDALQAVTAPPEFTRRQRLDALDTLFRAGAPPVPPLDGPYDGELVALDVAPGVTQLLEWLTSLWMPWKGKHLSQEQEQGDNVFAARDRLALRLAFPFYDHIRPAGPDTIRAFTFRTSVRAGRVDPDRRVFNIDYDIPENPGTIRRIVDELMQVDEGVHLGKIHFKWWCGRWQMIGYFALRAR